VADRGLIDALVEGGVFDRESAEEMASRVMAAIAARLQAGRTVKVEGVGTFASRERWQDTYCQGPGRVKVRVTSLRYPVELSRGEPRPLSKVAA
jgi:nucleoid DNA-binding protein